MAFRSLDSTLQSLLFTLTLAVAPSAAADRRRCETAARARLGTLTHQSAEKRDASFNKNASLTFSLSPPVPPPVVFECLVGAGGGGQSSAPQTERPRGIEPTPRCWSVCAVWLPVWVCVRLGFLLPSAPLHLISTPPSLFDSSVNRAESARFLVVPPPPRQLIVGLRRALGGVHQFTALARAHLD